MKIVINRCYGGFGLSRNAIKRYLELCGKECYFYEEVGSAYVKCDCDCSNYFVHCLTKDMGETIEDYPKDYYFSYYDIERNDQKLVQVVEELGENANGDYSKLEVVEIPDDVSWEIGEYDGVETISEIHRTWY